jgi:cysteinyl-tRNA synthetase
MNKNIIIALLAIAVAILLYFLLSNSKEPDTHTADNAIVQADNKIIIAQRDAGLRKIDSLEKDALKWGALADSLKKELSFTRRDLDKTTAKAVQLAREIRQLKDTTGKSEKCDSLAIEAENFAYLYNAYKTYVDSLTSMTNKSTADYQAALSEQKRLYDELYSKYEQLYKLYNILFKDHQQAGKKLRREKLKTKVAALLGLVGAGVIILK